MTSDERVELLNMLRSAHDEIVTLRRENARMAPQVRVLDILERAMFGPAREQGYGEDIAWRLKKRIDEIIAEREAEKAS